MSESIKKHPLSFLKDKFPIMGNDSAIQYRPITPPLEKREVQVHLYLGATEQNAFKMNTTGDATLGLLYKQCAVAALSWETLTENEMLKILQLQGGKSRKSYRGTTGIRWVESLAHILKSSVLSGDSPIKTVAMPAVHALPGMELEFVYAQERYYTMISLLGMRWSDIEKQFIGHLR
jgi:hypothetical protein